MSTILLGEYEALLSAAREVRERAYAPYSKFRVGAALDTGDGAVFLGCNVENASYGLSICAERAAVASAVTAGFRNFTAIAIAGPDGVLTSPCGACRQVLAEFNPAMTVIFTAPDGPVAATLEELLPHSFGPFV
ncbi:MAG TPA: cytidine deaminase [Candidatus Baltobacteraceae bacterium]|nr:cytidine deaminase [Candidatus Baltobacteraceae bacterium]